MPQCQCNQLPRDMQALRLRCGPCLDAILEAKNEAVREINSLISRLMEVVVERDRALHRVGELEAKIANFVELAQRTADVPSPASLA